VCISIFNYFGALSPFSTNFFTVLMPGRHGLPILCKNTLALIYNTTAGSEGTFLKGCAVSCWAFFMRSFQYCRIHKMNEKPFLKGSVSYNLHVRKVFFVVSTGLSKSTAPVSQYSITLTATAAAESLTPVSQHSITVTAAAAAESLTPVSQYSITVTAAAAA
jgi:hypothetical protein